MNSPTKIGLVLLLLAAVGVGGYFAYDRFLKPGKTPDKRVDVGDTGERAKVPVPQVTFTDVTAAAGIKFTHFSGATGDKLLPETMGSGVAVIDYDRDGKPDLLFVNSCPWPGHPTPEKAPCLALYRNKGNGSFEDATERVGLNVTLYGVGACVGDYDNDGFPDLFVTCVGKHHLFRNDGGKRFTDATATAKVGGPGVWPEKETAVQFKGHKPAIPFGSSATFVDYDGDGKLDLFVCHYCTWAPEIDLALKSTLTGVGRTYQQPTNLEGNQCALYRNVGDGTFEDVSETAGVRVNETDATGRTRPVGKSLGVIQCDPDGDGWADLVVANDTVRNFFFHNVPDGKGGRKFKEYGNEANIAYVFSSPRGAMGIDVGEFRPGVPAILIANFANEPNSFLTPLAPGSLRHADEAESVGVYGPSRGPLKFGAFFFDYDLDGRLDVLTCNGHIDPDITKVQPNQTYRQPAQLFWNAGEVFEPVTPADAGKDLFKPIVGRGAAYLDYDGDGDLDVVLAENGGPAVLLRNDQKTGHHRVRFTLAGDGKTSNRDAVGAEVVVEAGGKTYTRWVVGARGYLSQSEFTVTVGLGKTDTVDKVTVKWPGQDAKPQTWANLKADQAYILTQGVAEAK